MAGDQLKWGVLFSGDNLSLAETLAYAKQAEEAGAESLWTTELGRDAFVPLAAIACETSGVRLGTGVATFARPPMHTETAAMSLAELTDQNFVLGLGTAPPAWNENWHGLAYERPLQRMREYVECIRTMWQGTPANPVAYDGEIIKVSEYARFIPAPYPSVPIYLATVRKGMLQLAGEIADGVVCNLINTPEYFADFVRRHVQSGIEKAGRRADDVEICCTRICAVNEDAAKARELAKHSIALYSTIPYFDVVLEPAGFAEETARIRAAFAEGEFETMIASVSDAMVERLAFAGTAEQVLEQAEPYRGLVDSILLYCPSFFVDPADTRQNHAAMIDAFAAFG